MGAASCDGFSVGVGNCIGPWLGPCAAAWQAKPLSLPGMTLPLSHAMTCKLNGRASCQWPAQAAVALPLRSCTASTHHWHATASCKRCNQLHLQAASNCQAAANGQLGAKRLQQSMGDFTSWSHACSIKCTLHGHGAPAAPAQTSPTHLGQAALEEELHRRVAPCD